MNEWMEEGERNHWNAIPSIIFQCFRVQSKWSKKIKNSNNKTETNLLCVSCCWAVLMIAQASEQASKQNASKMKKWTIQKWSEWDLIKREIESSLWSSSFVSFACLFHTFPMLACLLACLPAVVDGIGVINFFGRRRRWLWELWEENSLPDRQNIVLGIELRSDYHLWLSVSYFAPSFHPSNKQSMFFFCLFRQWPYRVMCT